MSLLQHAAIPVRSAFVDYERAHVPIGDKVLEAVTGYAPDGSDRFAGRAPRAAEDPFDRAPLEVTRWGAAPSTQYFAGADPTTAAQLMRPVHPLETGVVASRSVGRGGRTTEEALAAATFDTPLDTKYAWPVDDIVPPAATAYPAPGLTPGGGGRAPAPPFSRTAGAEAFDRAESAWAASSALHRRPPTATFLAGAALRSADPRLDPALLRPVAETREQPLRIYSLQAFLLSPKNSDALRAALDARLTLVYKGSVMPSPGGPPDAVVGAALASRFYEYTRGAASTHLTEVGYDLAKVRDSWNASFAGLLHTELRNLEVSNRHAAAMAALPAHMPLSQTPAVDLRDWWLREGLASRRGIPAAVSRPTWYGDDEAKHRDTYEQTGIWYGAPERKPKGPWMPYEKVVWE